MKYVMIAVMAGLCCLTVVPRASAQIANGGFETGDFSSWNTSDPNGVEIEDSSFGTGPTEGNYQALIDNSGASDTSLGNGTSVSSIESFLGVPSGGLSSLTPNNDPSIGNAISQTFNASAGQTLSFDWNFLTNEDPMSNFNDFAFYSLNGKPVLLGDTFSPTLDISNSSYYNNETGFFTVNVPITSNGSYSLGFGALNQGDEDVNSGLLVDNVHLSGTAAVPEPATFWLMLLGLLCSLVLVKHRTGSDKKPNLYSHLA